MPSHANAICPVSWKTAWNDTRIVASSQVVTSRHSTTNRRSGADPDSPVRTLAPESTSQSFQNGYTAALAVPHTYGDGIAVTSPADVSGSMKVTSPLVSAQARWYTWP